MIKINNLHVNVEKKEILKGINLEVKSGELHVIMGRNGTGKSTISKAIKYASENDEAELNKLLPFKLREDNPDGLQPLVTGTEQLHQTLCFNKLKKRMIGKFISQSLYLIGSKWRSIFINTNFFYYRYSKMLFIHKKIIST